MVFQPIMTHTKRSSGLTKGLEPSILTQSNLSDMHNNKMERMNGEIRDREKTMRGLKINETPILQGYQLFHNFIRPHEALKGKTPAEACGIIIEGNEKWKTLIENASKKDR